MLNLNNYFPWPIFNIFSKAVAATATTTTATATFDPAIFVERGRNISSSSLQSPIVSADRVL